MDKRVWGAHTEWVSPTHRVQLRRHSLDDLWVACRYIDQKMTDYVTNVNREPCLALALQWVEDAETPSWELIDGQP